MQTLNAGTSGLIPKKTRLKLLTLALLLHSPFCSFIRKKKKKKKKKKKIVELNGHPEYFGIHYSWWNH